MKSKGGFVLLAFLCAFVLIVSALTVESYENDEKKSKYLFVVNMFYMIVISGLFCSHFCLCLLRGFSWKITRSRWWWRWRWRWR